MHSNYVIIINPEKTIGMAFAKNKVIAEELATDSFKTYNMPVGIYTLVDIIGEKRHHFLVKNNDGLIILDSRNQKNFDGYQTEIGARWVGERAAEDMQLEPGFKVQVI